MNWFSNFLTSSIGQKIVMSLTGLFLCLFLVIHVAGNTQLFVNDGGEMFNLYSYKMAHSPFIKLSGYITYIAILLHAIQGILLYFKNKSSKGGRYAVKTKQNASFSSRNMAFLGTVLLVYIVVHMGNFWYKMKFGTVSTVQIGDKQVADMYSIVMEAFQNPLLVLLYIVSMVILAFHLAHGFQSAFQTLGLNHKKYTPIIKNIGIGLFAILIPALFAAMPLYFYIKSVM